MLALDETMALTVVEMSQVGEARRAASALAVRLGFDETGCGKVALVVTEAATNLVKHAREGLIILRPLQDGGPRGVEVLALDKGPGMANLANCLRDGYSTVGTAGTGLGAIGRQAGVADIFSLPGSGTALLVRLWTASPWPGAHAFNLGVVSLPIAGESVCGDAWAVAEGDSGCMFLVADGLGHGLLAAEASRAAVRAFHAHPHLAPSALLQVIHESLRLTRGAAVAAARVDLGTRVVHFAGVGNIAGSVLMEGDSRSMVSHNGTVGHEARKFREFAYPFPPGATLVMHSDGLGSRWNLNSYPGLAGKDPSLIAGVLFRDFQRGRDDVTILVARPTGGTAA